MRGFTLTELIVVLAIVGALVSVTAGSYQAVLKAGDARHAALVYVDALREAQNRAKLMEQGTGWGATIVPPNVIVFSGTSYESRAAARDKRYALPGGVTITGATTTVFATFSGAPDRIATTTFANAYASTTVTLTSGGGIEFKP